MSVGSQRRPRLFSKPALAFLGLLALGFPLLFSTKGYESEFCPVCGQSSGYEYIQLWGIEFRSSSKEMGPCLSGDHRSLFAWRTTEGLVLLSGMHADGRAAFWRHRYASLVGPWLRSAASDRARPFVLDALKIGSEEDLDSLLGFESTIAVEGFLDWAQRVLGSRPPPHLVERYGPPPAGGPTGRRKTVEGIEFIELKPGYFRMGSEENEYERPRHWVEIGYSFWIAKTEVTNEQYERFAPENERSLRSPEDRTPVCEIGWEDAKRFCAWLEGRSELKVRLPSEAEWEFPE